MDAWVQRTARIIGEEGVQALAQSTVVVLGVGGVGSYAAESLARAGVGKLVFVDDDIVDETNINRQLVADRTTIGKAKATLMVERAHRVNPSCEATGIVTRITADNISDLLTDSVDFVVDAIDDVKAKIAVATYCYEHHIKEISSMGTGNRLHPEMLQIMDIHKTTICPLARKIRKELKKERVKHLPVVCSSEEPYKPIGEGFAPGSISFVPPVSGLLMAGYVVRSLIEKKESI